MTVGIEGISAIWVAGNSILCKERIYRRLRADYKQTTVFTGTRTIEKDAIAVNGRKFTTRRFFHALQC